MSHPGVDQLAAYGLGHLSDDEAVALESHLEICEPCCRTLAGLPGDTLASLVRACDGDVQCERETPSRASEPSRDAPLASLAPASIAGTTHAQPAGSVQPAAHAPAMTGQFGRYRLIKCLGMGGMGAVYLAYDPQLDRQVALKIPRISPHDGPQWVERFYREAKAAAGLDHPNICSVFDVGELNGTPYLAMAYVEGRPLSDFIRENKLPSPRASAQVIRKLALALQEAHARGVIHRDLKPSNIMIKRRREPVVMDFGLAQRIGKLDKQLTARGDVLGTPAYMSPEQAAGQTNSVGPASDIYSLGVILFELLCGRLPFDGPLLAMLSQIRTESPQPPSHYRPDVDSRLESICLKAMQKQADQRFSSMGAMAEALSEYLHAPDLTPVEGDLPASVGQVHPLAEEAFTDSLALSSIPAIEIEADALESLKTPFRPARWSKRLISSLLIMAAGAAVMVLLGIVIYLKTAKGTIQIVLSDPTASVEVKVDGETVEVAGSDEPLRLTVGEEHALVVQGKNFETVTKSFMVRRGGNDVLRIELVPKAVAIGAEGSAAVSLLHDFYAQPTAHGWRTMVDADGEVMDGGGPALSSDSLQFIFWKRGPAEKGGFDLYRAKRDSISEPFGKPVRASEVCTDGQEFGPAFTRDDLELYFRHTESFVPEWNHPMTVMRAIRESRTAIFRTPERANEFPPVLLGATKFSFDGKITFFVPAGDESTLHRAVWDDDLMQFKTEPTNLPRRIIGVQSAPNPVAIGNDASVVFIWDIEGKIWLAHSRTTGGADNYENPVRTLDLQLAVGHGGFAALSRDARLLIVCIDDELFAKRIPQTARTEILELLHPSRGAD